jgi:hypothetical protein
MQRNGAYAPPVEMLVDLERVGLMIDGGEERLVERRQHLAAQVNDRAMHLCDGTDGVCDGFWRQWP